MVNVLVPLMMGFLVFRVGCLHVDVIVSGIGLCSMSTLPLSMYCCVVSVYSVSILHVVLKSIWVLVICDCMSRKAHASSCTCWGCLYMCIVFGWHMYVECLYWHSFCISSMLAASLIELRAMAGGCSIEKYNVSTFMGRVFILYM